MPRLRVRMRLRFTRLPALCGERVFCALLSVTDPDARSYQDLSDLVEKKLTFMQLPASCHYTVFAHDEPTGERVVVDDAYFVVLMRRWLKQAAVAMARSRRAKRNGDHHNDNDDDSRHKRRRCDGDDAPSTPVLLGDVDDGGDDAKENSSSSNDDDDDDDDGGGVEVMASFDVEVSAPRHDVAAAATTTTIHTGVTAAAMPPPPTQTLPLTVANLAQLAHRRSDDDYATTAATATTTAAVTATTATATTTAATTEQRVSVAALTCPPVCANFVLCCVVLALRFKTPRPDVTVAEIDLCDAAAPAQQITAVTFDAVVQRAVRTHLRDDRRQVVELRRCYVRRKSDADVRYQTNAHPLLLRLDRTCSIEVVRLLPVPLPSTLAAPVVLLHADALAATTSVSLSRQAAMLHDATGRNNNNNAMTTAAPAVVRVREAMAPTEVVELGALARRRPPMASSAADDAAAAAVVVVAANAAAASASLSSSASSSSHSGSTATTSRRTVFSLAAFASSSSSNGCGSSNGGAASSSFVPVGGNVGCGVAHVAGAVPAALGRCLRGEQERYLAQQQQHHAAALAAAAPPAEPGVTAVTLHDVRRREPLLAQHASKEAERKARIRRRAAVQQRCLLCDLDCDDEAGCMAAARRLLEANTRNRGRHVPTMSELRDALSDRRRRRREDNDNGVGGGGERPARLVCRSTFVNMHTRSVHVVHCRCAHLCTSYQRGSDLEDLVLYELPMQVCALCGLTGATVSCYHPDCHEAYHVVCALFSGGYVNFGKKDPHLPCPACPRHTLVNLRPRAVDDVLHVDRSCWDDGIAFDSRVVEDGDLRDPDENDGE